MPKTRLDLWTNARHCEDCRLNIGRIKAGLLRDEAVVLSPDGTGGFHVLIFKMNDDGHLVRCDGVVVYTRKEAP